MAESGCTRLTAVVCTAYPRSRISVAACSNQNGMSISRYIVVAAHAWLAAGAKVQAVRSAHAQLASKIQRLVVVAVSVLSAAYRRDVTCEAESAGLPSPGSLPAG